MYNSVAIPDSESDDNYSEPAESEDEEFTVKKVSKMKKKEKVTKKDKPKPSPVSRKEKQPSKTSKSKSQAAGMFIKMFQQHYIESLGVCYKNRFVSQQHSHLDHLKWHPHNLPPPAALLH